MGFQRLFWGLLFVFDFRVQGFDMLPDTVGYILLAEGCRLLSEATARFLEARKLFIVLAVLAIPDFFPLQPGNSAGLYFVYSLATVALMLYALYVLISAIKAFAISRGDVELAVTAERRWLLFAVATVIAALPVIFAGAGPPRPLRVPGPPSASATSAA